MHACLICAALTWRTHSSTPALFQLFQGLYWVHFSTIVFRKLQFQTLTYSSQETSGNYIALAGWGSFPSFSIYRTVRARIHAMLVSSTVHSLSLKPFDFLPSLPRLPKVMLHHFVMNVSFKAQWRETAKKHRPVPTGSSRRSFCLLRTRFLFALVKCEQRSWTHAPDTAQTSVGTVSPLILCQIRTRLQNVSTLRAKSDKIRLESFPLVVSATPLKTYRSGWCQANAFILVEFWTCANKESLERRDEKDTFSLQTICYICKSYFTSVMVGCFMCRQWRAIIQRWTLCQLSQVPNLPCIIFLFVIMHRWCFIFPLSPRTGYSVLLS